MMAALSAVCGRPVTVATDTALHARVYEIYGVWYVAGTVFSETLSLEAGPAAMGNIFTLSRMAFGVAQAGP